MKLFICSTQHWCTFLGKFINIFKHSHTHIYKRMYVNMCVIALIIRWHCNYSLTCGIRSATLVTRLCNLIIYALTHTHTNTPPSIKYIGTKWIRVCICMLTRALTQYYAYVCQRLIVHWLCVHAQLTADWILFTSSN